MKKFLVLGVLAAAGTIALFVLPSSGLLQGNKLRTSPKPIADTYIVVLNEKTAGPLGAFSRAESAAQDLSASYGGIVKHVYSTALNGYSVEMSPEQAELLSQDDRVDYVEEDSAFSLSTVQPGATFGLDRIDQRDLPLNGNYSYTPTGMGVNAYIIDTGIRVTHTEFGGRAVLAYDVIGDGQNGNDCHGHGTHVAGTVGSLTYGVAKDVRLYSVRVMDCRGSGSFSGLIAAIDWVTANHVKPAVANMSLSGGASPSVNAAVSNSVAAGVIHAVAAGNSNADACNYSPSGAPDAITVGATTSADGRSSFSNFGTCVDIFAPGSSITSTTIASDTSTGVMSGTSMASPHVAGVAALYLQMNPTASPFSVRTAIVNSATSGRLTEVNAGSPNLLLYSLLSGSVPTPTPAPTPVPTPSPTPGPSCPGGTYSGSLSGSLATAYQPNGSSYYSGTSGLHTANLSGPAYSNFNLYLEKRALLFWTTVASSEGSTSTERIAYSGTAGDYRWRIYSANGSGSYSLCTARP